jgi:hypothetical protein
MPARAQPRLDDHSQVNSADVTPPLAGPDERMAAQWQAPLSMVQVNEDVHSPDLVVRHLYAHKLKRMRSQVKSRTRIRRLKH